jgi:hypothetical protein
MRPWPIILTNRLRKSSRRNSIKITSTMTSPQVPRVWKKGATTNSSLASGLNGGGAVRDCGRLWARLGRGVCPNRRWSEARELGIDLGDHFGKTGDSAVFREFERTKLLLDISPIVGKLTCEFERLTGYHPAQNPHGTEYQQGHAGNGGNPADSALDPSHKGRKHERQKPRQRQGHEQFTSEVKGGDDRGKNHHREQTDQRFGGSEPFFPCGQGGGRHEINSPPSPIANSWRWVLRKDERKMGKSAALP